MFDTILYKYTVTKDITMEDTITNPPFDLSLSSLSQQELEDQVSELAAHINAATYRWLLLIAEFDNRSLWQPQGFKSLAEWLNWKCGITIGAARSQIRVARSLKDLPLISAAFYQGILSFSKVRAMVRVATPENEEYLMMIARHGTASHLERLVQGYRRVVRNEDEMKTADQKQREQSLNYYYDDHGFLVIQARLTPEQGQAFINAIESADNSLREQRKSVTAVTLSEKEDKHEEVPFTAYRADGLSLLVENYLDQETNRQNGIEQSPGRTGGDRHQVVIHVDEAVFKDSHACGRCEIENGPPIAVDTMKRLSCDASLVRVVEDENGNILSVGRKTRSIPTTFRRALKLRDKGCRFPGCNSKHGIDAHHIEHWSNGGETKMDNLVCLCRYHHRLVHEDDFQVVRRSDGRIQFYSPKGNLIKDFELPERSDKTVEFLNQNEGLIIDSATSDSLWQGERMDLGMAVEGLLEVNGEFFV